MNKLFGLFLLALAFLPGGAEAASCFWVGGTGTWDQTNTGGGGSGGIKWASASGGTSACAATSGPAAGVPGPSDTATFDASSGGGTVTVDATINGTNTIQTLTAGAFTGTIDFSVNNPSITFSVSLSLSGSGARKFLMGTGTFTLTGNSSNIFDISTTTNLDPTSDFSTASYVIISNTTFDRTFGGGGRSFGPTTVSANTSRGVLGFIGANTFASLSIAAGNNIEFANAATQTITAAPTWTGTSSNPIYIRSNSANNVATIAIGSGTLTCDWCGLYRITGSGGTARNATNSLDFGRNSGVTITAPSGGSGGGRIIGG